MKVNLYTFLQPKVVFGLVTLGMLVALIASKAAEKPECITITPTP